jgi:hypothetical protein
MPSVKYCLPSCSIVVTLFGLLHSTLVGITDGDVGVIGFGITSSTSSLVTTFLVETPFLGTALIVSLVLLISSNTSLVCLA